MHALCMALVRARFHTGNLIPAPVLDNRHGFASASGERLVKRRAIAPQKWL